MTQALAPALWAEIRRRWEFDPDAPSFSAAAKRAADVHGFSAPGRSAVHARSRREKWARKGASLAGVAAAAALRADALVDAEGAKKAAVESAANAVQAFEQAANDRAEVLARHREEWGVVRKLMDEGLEGRAADPVGAFNRAKLTKITAESLALKQAGERRAWGLDTFVDLDGVDVTKLSDEALEAIAKGKAPKSLR